MMEALTDFEHDDQAFHHSYGVTVEFLQKKKKAKLIVLQWP